MRLGFRDRSRTASASATVEATSIRAGVRFELAPGLAGKEGTMRSMTRARPSPALLVAVAALIAALAGTAVAEVATTARLDKKEKKQVRKIARKQINKLASGLSVANADNATNAQNAVNAQNAESADNATTANNANAVDGVSAAGIRYRQNAVNNPTQILNLGGLQLVANCDGGDLSLTADTSVDNSQFISASMDAAESDVDNGIADEDFDTADAVLDLLVQDDEQQLLTVEYTRPATGAIAQSSATSVTLHVDNTAEADAPDCVVTGHALQNGGGALIVGPSGTALKSGRSST